MITDRIGLHSVLLPLLIKPFVWYRSRRRRRRGLLKLPIIPALGH